MNFTIDQSQSTYLWKSELAVSEVVSILGRTTFSNEQKPMLRPQICFQNSPIGKVSLPNSDECLRRRKSSCEIRQQVGFSLIELLVVMAIFSILAAFTVPALISMGSANAVTQGAHDVSDILEQARNQAILRQTYVWAAFKAVTNDGNADLCLGLIYSKDGTTNVAATNLQAVSRVIVARRVSLVRDVDSGTNFPSMEYVADGAGIGFSIGSVNFAGGHSITFTPRGQAMLLVSPTETDGFDPSIGVGLRQTRGLNVISNKLNDTLILLDGSVALSSIYR